jgi:hypothetical protein
MSEVGYTVLFLARDSSWSVYTEGKLGKTLKNLRLQYEHKYGPIRGRKLELAYVRPSNDDVRRENSKLQDIIAELISVARETHQPPMIVHAGYDGMVTRMSTFKKIFEKYVGIEILIRAWAAPPRLPSETSSRPARFYQLSVNHVLSIIDGFRNSLDDSLPTVQNAILYHDECHTISRLKDLESLIKRLRYRHTHNRNLIPNTPVSAESSHEITPTMSEDLPNIDPMMIEDSPSNTPISNKSTLAIDPTMTEDLPSIADTLIKNTPDLDSMMTEDLPSIADTLIENLPGLTPASIEYLSDIDPALLVHETSHLISEQSLETFDASPSGRNAESPDGESRQDADVNRLAHLVSLAETNSTQFLAEFEPEEYEPVSKPVTCSFCGQQYREDYIANHEARCVISTEGRMIVTCSFCHLPFQQYYIAAHVATCRARGTQGLVECTFCCDMIEPHLIRNHEDLCKIMLEGAVLTQCFCCGESFRYNWIKRHEACCVVASEGQIPVKCTFCEQSFEQQHIKANESKYMVVFEA